MEISDREPVEDNRSPSTGEEQLRILTLQLKVAQHLSLTGSFSVFPSTGKIVWSEQAYQIYEYDTSIEPTLKLIRRRVHPDDRQIFDEMQRKALDEGKDLSFHHRLLMPDGRVKHLKIIKRHIAAEPDQSVIVGAIMDVTEQKKAEEALRVSEHGTRSQLAALTDTLIAISQEPEPEKFLEHILRMIGQQLGAHSLGVWEMNSKTGRGDLVANLEFGRLYLSTPEEITNLKFDFAIQDHPVWAEFFRSGEHCVISQLNSDPIRVRLMDGPDTSWHDWCQDPVTNPIVKERLVALGIVAGLCVPMLVGGKVTGLIGVRFQHKRAFLREEVELVRALAHQAMLAMRLIRLSQQSRETAVVAERNRLARDIHDALAQGLTGVMVQLEAAQDAQAQNLSKDAAAHIECASELARESLQEARRSVHALRPLVLARKNLCAAMEELIRKMTTGMSLRAEFTIQGEPQALPQEWEENLLRIGQEVLTNSLRHAGASRFKVHFAFDAQTIRLELGDDGRGFDPAKRNGGFGLLGINERVEAMGGELTLQSTPENGTAILVVLPLVKHSPLSKS